tara:strand:- start:967 stop:1266 length:300 start_codon:yes stop_codon:yes gene_type:complete
MNLLPDDVINLIYQKYYSKYVLSILPEYIRNKKNYRLCVIHINILPTFCFDNLCLGKGDFFNNGAIYDEENNVYIENCHELILSRFLNDIKSFILNQYN